jgi:hypothetical protein
MVGSMSLQAANVASGPLNFRQFAMCLEMALMLRLKVDATFAVPVLSKTIGWRPCKGAANDGFFGVKKQLGNCSPLLTLGFFLALAGWEEAIQLLLGV